MGVHGLPDNATVVEDVDAAGFHAYIKALLATPTQPARPFR